MKTTQLKTVALGLVTVWLGATSLLAQSGADVVANKSVGSASLDKAALKDILLGKTAYWSGGEAVVIVVLTDKADEGIQDVTGMSGSAFKTWWQRLAFSGRGKQPKEADTVEKVMAIVAETKGAIALIPAGTALAGIKKIEVKK